MANISSGPHTIREILEAAGFDFESRAAAEYNAGKPDYRRVKVGGLNFDDLDKVINVPEATREIVISLDDKPEVIVVVE